MALTVSLQKFLGHLSWLALVSILVAPQNAKSQDVGQGGIRYLTSEAAKSYQDRLAQLENRDLLAASLAPTVAASIIEAKTNFERATYQLDLLNQIATNQPTAHWWVRNSDFVVEGQMWIGAASLVWAVGKRAAANFNSVNPHPYSGFIILGSLVFTVQAAMRAPEGSYYRFNAPVWKRKAAKLYEEMMTSPLREQLYRAERDRLTQVIESSLKRLYELSEPHLQIAPK